MEWEKNRRIGGRKKKESKGKIRGGQKRGEKRAKEGKKEKEDRNKIGIW